MRISRTLLALSVLSAVISAQSVGPDVIVGSLNGVDSYGSNGGIHAYALGTTSCNIGNVDLSWIANQNQHPVIAQNIYRLKNGRFEQIGMSWLKHGFTALTQNLCNVCDNPNTGSLLGVGCSDPYSAFLNGSQSNGPRNEVNPATGAYQYPIGSYPAATAIIGRRIQCAAADVNPALNVGALYFGEGQYVTPDDARASNQNNNASYRAMSFAGDPPLTASLVGGTVQQLPAIRAWQAADPAVVIENVDFPKDGRLIVGKKITNLGGGNFHYEFAVFNLNSDRAARAFTVNFPAGTTISNPGFKDINYHSGEPYSNADWIVTNGGDSISWATDTWAVNPNANALRWGTLYNFWCDATAAVETSKVLEPFKCPTDTPVVPALTYAVDLSAPFDDPAITGTNGPVGDNTSANVPIGFTFNFYGVNYTSAYISTNGFLTFVNAGTGQLHNTGLPVATSPNASIAGFWDNLNAPAAGMIKYATIGTAPNRRFVVHWNNVQISGSPAVLENFKIILDETTNVITSTIISSGTGGASASRGLERQGGIEGVQASLNTAGSAVASTSWTYTPIVDIQPSANLDVTGSIGPNGVLTWTVDSNANNAPVIIIASLDPGPTFLGNFGTLLVGFAPGAAFIIADGTGIFVPADPAHVTSAPCGQLSVSALLDSNGLPPGLTIYNQALVFTVTSNPLPPNGLFHITDLAVLNT